MKKKLHLKKHIKTENQMDAKMHRPKQKEEKVKYRHKNYWLEDEEDDTNIDFLKNEEE